MSELFITPLNDWHRQAGAKMVPFAGWDMPVQYDSIIAEHKHTRENACVFDICHMGEFLISGAGAKDGLAKIVTHNLETLAAGKCRYGFMLNEKGGVLDDLIVYCLGEDDYMLVVNGACEKSDFDWIKSHLPQSVSCVNKSAETAKIDLQGPKSLEALEEATGTNWKHLKYFNFEKTDFNGKEMIVSRTGYTGELGYEFYLPAENALALWEKLVAVETVKPAGLGARDTLRLEMGLPLYGQDLDTDHTPKEAGYGFLLKSEADFTGKAGLETVKQVLVPLSIEGRRSARHHDKVLDGEGNEIGVVTSGSFAPSLGHSIALAYVEAEKAELEVFTVQTARKALEAKKAELPFYKEGTARKKLD